jgi:hypothetical protein
MAFGALKYGLRLLVVFVVISAVATVGTGGRFLVGIKWGLFLLGWATFGYSTFLLWAKTDRSAVVRSHNQLGQVLDRLTNPFVPESLRSEDDSNRQSSDHTFQLPDDLKLFVGSLVVLGASFLLETLFGVAG